MAQWNFDINIQPEIECYTYYLDKEAEAQKKRKNYCDDWFAAVCTVQYEKDCENVTRLSRLEGWDRNKYCE